MRHASFALLLAACSEQSPDIAVDASRPSPPPIDGTTIVARCDAPDNTAAITAAYQDLQPQYARVFAGGVFTGGEVLTFTLRLFFTNDPVTAVSDIISCEAGFVCPSANLVVDIDVLDGVALGTHPAVFRNSRSTWQASGQATLTDFVVPGEAVGHVAGTIHVDSSDPQVIVNGTFDHGFCLGLVGFTLF